MPTTPTAPTAPTTIYVQLRTVTRGSDIDDLLRRHAEQGAHDPKYVHWRKTVSEWGAVVERMAEGPEKAAAVLRHAHAKRECRSACVGCPEDTCGGVFGTRAVEQISPQ